MNSIQSPELQNLIDRYSIMFLAREIPFTAKIKGDIVLPDETRDSILRQLSGWLSTVQPGQAVRLHLTALPGGCEIEMQLALQPHDGPEAAPLPYMEIHQSIDPAVPALVRKLVAKG